MRSSLTTTGARPPAYEDVDGFVGEGDVTAGSVTVTLTGDWVVSDDYGTTDEVGAAYELAYNGTSVRLRYAEGPDRSEWAVAIDGVDAIVDHLLRVRGTGDVIVTLSNGAFGAIWEKLLDRLGAVALETDPV